MQLYENIKKRRKEMGLTQEELARLLGYADKSAITHIEKGRVNLPVGKIEDFARVLGTTPGELMGKTEMDKTIDRIINKFLKLSEYQQQLVENMIDQFLGV